MESLEERLLKLIKELEEEKHLADKRAKQLYDKPPGSHTHPGSDITSQVSDSDKIDGQHASYFAEKTQENWIAPTLLNSWVNFSGAYSPAGYFKDALGIVHLRGMVKSGTIGNYAIFALPGGYRPAFAMYVPTISNSLFGGVLIYADTGNVCAMFGNNTWFSLEGITFGAA